MLNQRLSPFITLRASALQLVAACGIGLLLGVTCVLFSPLWMLVVLAGICFFLATFKRPEVILLGYLLLTSTLVDPSLMPSVSVGIGTLYLTDMLILLGFGMIILRWLGDPEFRIIRTPLDIPLLLFWGAALLSTSLAILQGSLELRRSLGEIRIVNGYLTFFVVTNLVRHDCQVRLLMRGLSVLAVIVAAAMLVQFVLGPSVAILPGRVEALYTEGVRAADVTRILAPGLSLVVVAFIGTTVSLVLDRFRSTDLLGFLRWALLALAVVLTFNRSLWLGVAFQFFALACLVAGKSRRRLIGRGLLAILLLTMVMLPVLGQPESRAAKLVSATAQRVASFFSRETLQDPESTLRWRDFEYRYALSQIISHPLLGLGLGARYRPLVPGKDWVGFDGRAFIHNGHVWIMLKSGLIGYLGMLWLSLAFLMQGIRHWQRIPDPEMKGRVLAFCLAYIVVLIDSMARPSLMTEHWTPLIGIMMGVTEVVVKGVAHGGDELAGADQWQHGCGTAIANHGLERSIL